MKRVLSEMEILTERHLKKTRVLLETYNATLVEPEYAKYLTKHITKGALEVILLTLSSERHGLICKHLFGYIRAKSYSKVHLGFLECFMQVWGSLS